MGTCAAFCTAFYSIRLIYLVFFHRFRGYNRVYKSIHELPIIMAIPLMFLCFGSIFSGYLFRDIFVGLGSCFFSGSIFILPSHYFVVFSEYIPLFYKLLPNAFSLIATCFSLWLYSCRTDMLLLNQWYFCRSLYKFLLDKWFFDALYNLYIVKYLFNWGFFITYVLIDKGFIETVGPYGFINFFFYNTTFFTLSGIVYNYVMFIGLNLTSFFFWYYEYFK